MADVTLSLNDRLLASPRKYASEHNTSLNALIRALLEQTVGADANADWLDECFELMDRADAHSAGWQWNREDLYDG